LALRAAAVIESQSNLPTYPPNNKLTDGGLSVSVNEE